MESTVAKFPAIAEETLDLIQQASTATLTTQLFRRGLRQQFLVGVRPFNPNAARFAGEAFTMRFIPAREDLDTLEQHRKRGSDNLQWEGFEQVGPRQVLIIDSRDDVRGASAGEILVTRLWRRGATAIITDGAFRDGPRLSSLPFPIFAKAMTASTRLSFFHVADLQVPIGCAGVAVFPGDIIVGDLEGVVVVPRHMATDVARDAARQEELEDYIRARVERGEELWGLYPPTDEVRTAFDAARKPSS